MMSLLLFAFLPLALVFTIGNDDDDNNDSSDELPRDETDQESGTGEEISIEDPDQLTLGTAGDDTITGTDGTDSVRGEAGDDRIFLKGGDDRGEISLATEDELDAATSPGDFLDIYENTGLFGAVGGTGDDFIDGGHGDDAITGSQGDDTLRGNLGSDFLVDVEGENQLFGGYGNDELMATDIAGAPDLLDGGGNDDLLIGDKGDTMTGGEGTDTFSIWWHEGADPVHITDFGHIGTPASTSGTGEAIVVQVDDLKDVSSFEATHDGTNLTISLNGNSVAQVTGVSPEDFESAAGAIFVTDDINSMQASFDTAPETGAGQTPETGDDTAGNDAGTGEDTTAGGEAATGEDTTAGGDDTSAGETDPQKGDSIVGASAAPGEGADLYGTLLNDTLRGTDYSDTLNGSSGDDTLWLEGGDDGNLLDANSANFIFSGSSISVSASLLEANDFFGGVGGAGNDYIDGGSGNDSLLGGAGDDMLRGNTGDDMLFDHLGSDTFDGGYGDDALVALDAYQGSSDVVNGGAGDDMLFIDDGDQATGGAGWDSFVLSPSEGEGSGQAVTITDFNPTPSGDSENGTTGEAVLIDVADFKESDDFTIGQTGADVTVSLWGQSVAVLQNTQLSDLQPTSVMLGIDSTLNTSSPEIHLPRTV
ncbi:calcium-binding protein [Thioclava sp.]|uniref:calcium-binding protein n=1 Tax=Thioclava sp. TaxID=1933450 RepID=UPI003AA8D469